MCRRGGYLTITGRRGRGKDAGSGADPLYTTADHKYVDDVVELKRREEPTLPRFKAQLLWGENGSGLAAEPDVPDRRRRRADEGNTPSM